MSSAIQLSKIENADSIVKPDEILIKTSAAAVNPLDILLRELTPKLPCIGSSLKVAGFDFSGVVIQIGEKFHNKSGTELKVGNKVFGGTFDATGVHNSFTEYIGGNTDSFTALEKVSDTLTMPQAGGLNTVTHTAYQCFFGMEDRLEGGNVLILGAASSVGHMAIQWAKLFGVKNIIVTASPRSSEAALKAGDTSWIDYTKGEDNERKQVKELLKSIGKFDLIVDTVRDLSVYSDLGDNLKTKKEGGDFNIVNGSLSKSHISYLSDMIPPLKFIRIVGKSRIGL
ncbi:unnamed protein product [Ambrosiozyma monospora]|uniref:Unnamed protein product n=1 Tax=Ambrosiozyma monospora TaxID=43982 RepID=A0ACB5SV06_AMBMO|nr:unnamed protein product [Ambrosiozyma monospora]